MDLYDLNAETMTKFKPKTYEQVRLENACEAWKVHKSIYIDPVTAEPLQGFQPWPQFRDEFLTDWKSNRRLVTEKEADVIFNRIADESLAELENIGALQLPDVNALAEQVAAHQDDTIGVIVENPVTVAPVVAVKRRGRPAKVTTEQIVKQISAEVAVATVKPVKVVKVKVAKVAKAVKPVKAKKAVAAKKGGNTSLKAKDLIEKYGKRGRGWSRKDIIVKLTESIDGLGAAYASTLYQKFSK